MERFFRLCLILVLTSYALGTTIPVSANGSCGTGTWTPGNLELHHINVGQGDSSLIVGPTGKSLLFDVGEESWNSSAKAQLIGPYIESVLGCKALDYVVISHFHLDHIGYVGYGGLWHLVETQGVTVGTTLVRDYNTYLGDSSGTFTNWKAYLEGAGQTKLHPVTAMEGTAQVDLGTGVIFNIVAVDGNQALIAGNFSADASPPSENDYSLGALISFGDFDEWIGGDMDGAYETSGFGYTYHDIELSVAPEVGDVDVYRVNHHGSSHSSSPTFVHQLDPEVSIISVGAANPHGHPAQPTMDRLLDTSAVYLTERGDPDTEIGAAVVAGTIIIKTSDGSSYTVNGTSYTATEPTRADADGDGYFAEVDPADNNPNLQPAPNGGCGPVYQTCSVACEVSTGQVLINEVFPAPSNNGTEWVELYNTTASTINIGYCIVDDIAGGSAPYSIPAGTLIPGHGFWTLDRNSYFNNAGDEARLLKEDEISTLDSYAYGSTPSNVSWYRLPDGGPWANGSTSMITKGQSNNAILPPTVLNSARASANPTNASSVDFQITFSEAVDHVDIADFSLVRTGITGASILGVSGSGDSFLVTVGTGTGNGTLRLDVIDNDTIRDSTNDPLGGTGIANGNFTSGETYTVIKTAPAAPVLLSPANGALATSLRPDLDWGDVVAADHYQVQVSTNSAFAALAINESEVGISSFVPTSDLLPGKLYYWRVRAFNVVGGASNWSAVRNFKTSLDTPILLAPGVDQPLLVLRPTFDWDGVNGATNYVIQVSPVNTFSSFLVNATLTTTEYSPTRDLPPNAPLSWRVLAKNSVVIGPWSAPRAFTTGNPPTVPLLTLPANNSLVRDYTPTFDWRDSTAPGGAVSYYRIWVDDNADFSSPEVDTTTSVSNFIPSVDLAHNTKLYWKVQAVNTVAGNDHVSAWSVTWSFRTLMDPPTLISPNDGFHALVLRPTFYWDAPSGTGTISGYTIQISKNDLFTQIVHTGNPVASNYTPTADLPKGLSLYWRVQTKGVNGPSAWSAARSFTSANSPTTPVPSLPTSNALITNFLPLFKWSAVTLPANTFFKHYELQVDDNSDFSSPVIDDISITDRLTVQLQILTPLAQNTRFFWRVRAVNTADEVSNWSAVRYFRTVIRPPSGLSFTLNGLQPSFNWDDATGPANITGYTIQVSTTANFSSFLVNSTTSVSLYNMLRNLPAGRTIYWRVRVNGANGPSAWTTAQFTTP